MTRHACLRGTSALSAAALGIVAGLGALTLAPSPLSAQGFAPCSGVVFSTEEDFVTQAGEPPDGIPVISDGDLLSVSFAGGGATVCARNRHLLQAFDVRVDLGLDAVDVIDAEAFVIAFSTELDHPHGAFTAGDLLFTTGGVLPNAALLAAFDLQIPRDMGLDAVHLIGDPDRLKRLVEVIRNEPRDVWIENPKRLPEVLQETGTDIWFSTEGTELPPPKPAFLDGDLLSAKNGIIVARNSLLLPPPVPAGIPDRGVDFGLDAVTGSREEKREAIHFSTEILYDGEKPTFTDGDVLRLGNGVVIPHQKLVAPFEPKARFLGLDALHFQAEEPLNEPNLQSLCGRKFPDLDFDGGRVPPNGGGTGLYFAGLGGGTPAPPRRPCGEFVAFDGILPNSGIDRFRVAYRKAGTPRPAPGTAPGIKTEWQVKALQLYPLGCNYITTLSTDASPQAWMDASDFLAARDNFPCSNPAMQLAVWDTKALGTPDKDDHFVVWLEWDDGTTIHQEAVEHHVQLDNTLPKIAPFPDGLQLRLPGGGPNDLVPACGEAPSGTSKFEVWGQFADDYYWDFRLNVKGGVPPNIAYYGPHAYYDATDGPPGLKNTDDTGTKPGSPPIQHLRDIDMTDLGDSFQDCCYILNLWVRDAAIRHSFNLHREVNDNSGALQFQANAFITFAASP